MGKKLFNVFLKGLLAGIAISVGGLIFIMTRKHIDNFVAGAYLFSTGLILVCNFGYFLYTGKICYLIDELKKRVGWIAPITIYPGEDELLALAQGAIRAMTGEEEAKEYI